MIAFTPVNELQAHVCLPGSKYQANRALVVAALSDGESVIKNVPENDDIQVVIRGMSQFGAHVERKGSQVVVRGTAQLTLDATRRIHTGASGTFSRFATAIASLYSQPVTLIGSARMNERPMNELFAALRQLGAVVDSSSGTLPATITGPLVGGHCLMNSNISSQYLSALLLAAPYAKEDVYIEVSKKLAQSPFVAITLQLMERFGVVVERPQAHSYLIRSSQAYQPSHIALEPDPSSASYFLAAAAIVGGSVTVSPYPFNSVQGEARFFEVLTKMGCDIKRRGDALTLLRDGDLFGVDVDMSDMPDVVQTLAAVACFARGQTVMRGIENLVYKESNRISDTAQQLSRLGVMVTFDNHSMTIAGGQKLHAGEIDPCDDHRMAMALSLIGLKVPGVFVQKPDTVAKSFPQFWSTMTDMGVSLNEVAD